MSDPQQTALTSREDQLIAELVALKKAHRAESAALKKEHQLLANLEGDRQRLKRRERRVKVRQVEEIFRLEEELRELSNLLDQQE